MLLVFTNDLDVGRCGGFARELLLNLASSLKESVEVKISAKFFVASGVCIALSFIMGVVTGFE